MSLDTSTLQHVALNGEMDHTKWPTMLDPFLQRLNHIIYNEFPLPQPYPTVTTTPSIHQQSSSADTSSALTTQATQTPSTPRQLPPVPPFPGSAAASETSHVPNSQPEESSVDELSSQIEIPVLLLQLKDSIVHTLQTSFASSPPHTIQRLSELILHPRKHYRTLPAWLRAVDRVVSVSSTADIFPLSDAPAMVNGVNGDGVGAILWASTTNLSGNGPSYDSQERDGALGSDESLGGALLTPIPWLRDTGNGSVADYNSIPDLETAGTEVDSHSTDDLLADPIIVSEDVSIDPATVEIPGADVSVDEEEGDGSGATPPAGAAAIGYTKHDPLVPERPEGAVTQGELMRMEQEAGVIPVNHSQSAPSPPLAGGRADAAPNSVALGVGVGLETHPDIEEESQGPYARGPDVVGTVDMGRVGGKDVQVRIGSPPDEGMATRSLADVSNDAQQVLSHPSATPNVSSDAPVDGTAMKPIHQPKEGSPTDTDDFVHVSKEGASEGEAEVDEMQLDSEVTTSSPKTRHQQQDHKADGHADEDIVLVDADGATEEERSKIDESGEQMGNDGTQTTR